VRIHDYQVSGAAEYERFALTIAFRAASNKDVMADHEDAIISAIRNALVDSEASVRAAAARTFDAMQHYIGPKAVDQTIPTLLEAMRNPGEASETALQALQEVMSVSDHVRSGGNVAEQVYAGAGKQRLPRPNPHTRRPTHHRLQRPRTRRSRQSGGYGA
jgi:hypothetical protein